MTNKEKCKNYKMTVYFLNGKTGYFYSPFHNPEKGLLRMKKILVNCDPYKTALIYNRETGIDVLTEKYVFGNKIL